MKKVKVELSLFRRKMTHPIGTLNKSKSKNWFSIEKCVEFGQFEIVKERN